MTLKLQAIGLVGTIGASEAVAVVTTDFCRPIKMYSSVDRLGLATVHDIRFGNVTNGCLIQSIDAWEFSIVLVQERRKQFLEAHHLTGKPDEFIDLYLEENNLSMPDAPPLYAPTIRKDDRIVLTGSFNTRCAFSMFGYTR